MKHSCKNSPTSPCNYILPKRKNVRYHPFPSKYVLTAHAIKNKITPIKRVVVFATPKKFRVAGNKPIPNFWEESGQKNAYAGLYTRASSKK